MTQVVLAAMLAGYLALAPAEDNTSPGGRRRFASGTSGSDRRSRRFSSTPAVYAVRQRVLILDHPFEPCCVYIRIDNAVYALGLHTLDPVLPDRQVFEGSKFF